MKINTPYWQTIRREWRNMGMSHQQNPQGRFKVFNKGKRIEDIDWWSFYMSNDGKQIAFRIKKHYWAKGRKMRIESEFENIPSGEYVIVEKAQSNSYDETDYLVVELVPLELETPRKALNWLERQLAVLESQDGKTTEDFVRELNVRGL